MLYNKLGVRSNVSLREPAKLGVCAGIVLFHPDVDRLKENINAIMPQVDKIILVNNAPEDIGSLKDKLEAYDLYWIENEDNLGIAAALNQLIDYAHDNGFEWVLTLDQDGICADGLVEKLLTAAAEHGNIAMVSPLVVERGGIWDDVGLVKTLGDGIEEVKFCITSGTLTNVDAVINTGGFNEKLFIDEVDRDMCIRLRYKGYRMLRVKTAELRHEFGLELVQRRVLFKVYKYRNYSPFRVYYQIRNMVYMVRKYGADYKPCPAWRLIRPFFTFFIKFIFEQQRLRRLSAFIRGYAAGLTMKPDSFSCLGNERNGY